MWSEKQYDYLNDLGLDCYNDMNDIIANSDFLESNGYDVLEILKELVDMEEF